MIEQQTISSGASGLNAGQIGSTGWGNIPDLNSYLTHGSLEIFKSLQLDSNYDIEFRQSGSLAAIQTKSQYDFVMDTVMQMKKAAELPAIPPPIIIMSNSFIIIEYFRSNKYTLTELE